MVDENTLTSDYLVELKGSFLISGKDYGDAERMMKKILEVVGNKYNLEIFNIKQLTVKDAREYEKSIEPKEIE